LVSGCAALADVLVKVLFIAVLHVPLFLFDPRGDMAWAKWGFWLAHSLLGLLAYAAVLALPFTPWRELLPARAPCYSYAAALLGVYTCMAVGAALIGSQVVPGYCLYGVGTWLYFSCLGPLVYVAFLAEFFSDDGLDVDLLYYSEMRDAGVFDER
jgi:hypothetical protein